MALSKETMRAATWFVFLVCCAFVLYVAVVALSPAPVVLVYPDGPNITVNYTGVLW